MVIVLTGDNDFLRQRELTKLIQDFIDNHGDFGLEKLDAGELELGRLIESVASLPFLSDKRMIVLSGITENKSLSENFDKLLDQTGDSTVLVINQPKFDKRSKLYKALKKQTDFREFNELDERALADWLVKEAVNRGGILAKADASLLIKRAGINQMNLSHELDKLISFNPEISKKAILELVEPMPSSTIFELIEAAFQDNHKKAIELYLDQRKQQVEPQAIMGMIAWQVHTMTLVKFHENDHPSTIASNTKINPYVVRKTLDLVSKKSKDEIKRLLSKTLTLDVRLKTEAINADDALQHYLLTI